MNYKPNKKNIPEHLQKLFDAQKRRNKLSGLIFGSNFIVVLVLAFILPKNILEDLPNLNLFVNWASELVPSIRNFGEISKFPQISQLVFTLEVIFLPVLVLLLMRTITPVTNLNAFKWLAGIILLLIMGAGYFYWLPGDGIGYGYSSNVSSSIINSKIFFSFWTSAFSFAFAGFFAALLKNIKK